VSGLRGFAAALVLTAVAGCGTAPTNAPSSNQGESPAPSLPDIGGWREAQVPAADGVGGYTTVVAIPSGFVVAGGTDRPFAWSSPDGESWRAEEIPGDARLPVTSIPWGDRVLALGSGEFAPGCGHPAAIGAWVRDSTGTWSQAPFQQLFCAGGVVSAAAIGDLAVVVVAGNGEVPYSWTSSDGLHWTDHPGAFEPGRLPRAVTATVGGFVASGSSDRGPWVASSVDGALWSEPAGLPGPAFAAPLGMSVAGGTLTILLQSGESVGVAWSADGREWNAQPVAGLVASRINRIEAIEDGLVAIGNDARGPALWVSADGRSWRPMETAGMVPGASVTDVAVGHGRAVLLGGIEPDDGRPRIAAWVGPASLLAP
jgi:hypothetical protein